MKSSVRKLRTQRGLSEEELAYKVGVSKRTIISIEKEMFNPPLALAFKLAYFFDRSVEELFELNYLKAEVEKTDNE